jgi:hypothetical protein
MNREDMLYVTWLDENDPQNGIRPREWWED